MYVADLHLHSKYSRATSRNMEPRALAQVARRKGVHLLGTGDVLHPAYRQELKEILREKGNGVYEYDGVDFLLTTETSHVFSQNGKLRKIHLVLLFPDFDTVDRVARKLESLGGNLTADGRPTFGLSVVDMLDLLFSVNEEVLVIPAHAWTPWFSLFGSRSGFDSPEEALGPFLEKVPAIETGLSSDPPMNWRVSALDRFVLVSNSDAHSPDKIGREANVFSEPVDFYELRRILFDHDRQRFLFTIEFFPEEGKYHYDGHRSCGVRFHPRETRQHRGLCPVCGRPLTVGVLYRVEQLADRPEGYIPPGAIPYRHLVPLKEILADVLGVGPNTKKVAQVYETALRHLGPELEILLRVPEADLERWLGPKVARAIVQVRRGEVQVEPGYDGVYGTVRVAPPRESPNQGTLF